MAGSHNDAQGKSDRSRNTEPRLTDQNRQIGKKPALGDAPPGLSASLRGTFNISVSEPLITTASFFCGCVALGEVAVINIRM